MGLTPTLCFTGVLQMSISDAFHQVCNEAKVAGNFYVSLYSSQPYYGGPEEGGWWGSDTVLEAYQRFDSEEAAEAAREQVEALAAKMNREAKQRFGEQCLREMEWCDNRGVDYDYLPEPDGEESYFVTIEASPGEQSRQGCRHYE